MKRISVCLGVTAALVFTVAAKALGMSPSSGVNAGNGSSSHAAGHAMANPHNPNPNASANSAAIQSILQKFDTTRDQMISARQALIDKLAAAKTDTERQSILDQLRTEQQSMQDQQRTMAKEIRAEIQALRRQRSGG